MKSKSVELPGWADSIRRKYLRGEASIFLLHHNVFDHVVHDGKLLPLTAFLSDVLLHENKRNLLIYDPSSRVRVVRWAPGATTRDAFVGKRTASDVLPALEELMLTTSSTAVIVQYLEMIAPNGEMHFMSESDRQSAVSLHRWSLDGRLAEKDNVVFLVTEQLSAVHTLLVSNPRIASVAIPLPDLATRETVCKVANPELDAREAAELARQTSGLKAIQIHGLLAPDQRGELGDEERLSFIQKLLGQSADAPARAKKLSALTRSLSEDEIRHLIDPENRAQPGAAAATDPSDSSAHDEVLRLVRARKREIIETECFGLIEFIEARHGFAAVGGMVEIKHELTRVAEAVRSGDRARTPMGLLFVGPMGTGKTFVASAFAKESGITAVKLKNFRSKWVGATESNLEKVLTIIRALGPILLVIDEGDRSFGDSGDGDGGTSSRVIARIKEFMSDPDNRGHVVFMLLTNRPDKLDTDIKRAGRLDRKIPFFYAAEPADVEGILDALLRRYGVASTVEWPRDRAIVSAPLVGYSNADLEAVVLAANDLAHDTGSQVTSELLAQAIRDYLPSRDEAMLRYMELLAVFEASSRKLLPPKYRDLTNEQLDEQLRQARLFIPR
ncbi:MAG TPA: AAA family ATPase [Polyangiales bacterium]|nr:AAA family ATPase [Polyangiales bacterium]